MRRGDFLKLFALSAAGLGLGGGVMPSTEQQLDDFRRRIETLETQAKKAAGALILGPQQQGPLPGWMRATRIEGQQMLIDMTRSLAGTAPRISVTDTSNVVRAEMGNLASYSGPNGVNSPAQYGFRANDSVGNAIFDSLGLIAVMTQPGGAFFPGTVDPFTNGTASPVVISGAPSGQTYSLVYTVTRVVTMLQIAAINAQVTTSAANSQWNWGISTDNAGAWDTNAVVPLVDSTGGAYTSTISISVLSVAAGAHTMRVLGGPTGGILTAHIIGGAMYAFQLGA